MVKNAGLGLKAAAQGKPMTSEQKGALRSVALKIAVKLAFAAVGAALPGIGHLVGHAIEKIAPLQEASYRRAIIKRLTVGSRLQRGVQ